MKIPTTELDVPGASPLVSAQSAAQQDLDLERLIVDVGYATRDVFLRRDSSDTHLVGELFVDRALDLSRLPRVAELRVFSAACREVGRRPLIIDAGANIGLSAMILSLQCSDALVVAIEPDPGNFQLLVANTDRLPILPLPCAVGPTAGHCILEDPGEGEWGYRTRAVAPEEQDAHVVATVSIDEIMEAHAISCVPIIVKIDIEGAEKELFDAEAAWVDKTPLIIVELHDWMLLRQRSAQPVLRRLLRSDRDFVIIGENIFSMMLNLPGMPDCAEVIR